MIDLLWAIAHHLLAFALFGVLFAEFCALRASLDTAQIRRIASLDLAYGIIALLLILVGFSRANFAAKGWHYYSHNSFFGAKIATFAAIGLLSFPPTFTFNRWRSGTSLPDAAALRKVRLYLHIELTLFVLLPILAAAMARGYGEF